MKGLQFCFVAVGLLAGSVLSADWPQLGNGPQRQGYQNENIDTPIENAWAYGFAPERLFSQVQPVIVADRVYIGSEMGKFRCFNGMNGSIVWTYPPSGSVGPILGTAGVEGDKVFFGSMDGSVYALSTATGGLVWKFTSDSRPLSGFCSAVLLAESKVFIPNRHGIYYCLEQSNGTKVWERDMSTPILMSSAYDKGKIYFGAANMHVYAIASSNGSTVWDKGPFWGMTFADYYPVVFNNYVFIRSWRAQDSGDFWGGDGYVVNGKILVMQTGLLPQSELDKQDEYLEKYAEGTWTKDQFVLDKNNGNETIMVHMHNNAMNGAVCPPCVTQDGKLVVPIFFGPDSYECYAGWGKLDISIRKVIEVLYDGPSERGWPHGTGTYDESLSVSSAGPLVFTFHHQEANAHFTGCWHIGRRQWTRINPYGEDSFWSNVTESRGIAPPAISNGRIYHTLWSNLNCRTATVK